MYYSKTDLTTLRCLLQFLLLQGPKGSLIQLHLASCSFSCLTLLPISPVLMLIPLWRSSFLRKQSVGKNTLSFKNNTVLLLLLCSAQHSPILMYHFLILLFQMCKNIMTGVSSLYFSGFIDLIIDRIIRYLKNIQHYDLMCIHIVKEISPSLINLSHIPCIFNFFFFLGRQFKFLSAISVIKHSVISYTHHGIH